MKTITLVLFLIVGIAVGIAISRYWMNRSENVGGARFRNKDHNPSAVTFDPETDPSDLEQRVDETELSTSEEVRLLHEALDAIPQGIIVCSSSGEVLLRNKVALSLFDGRHQDVLAARAFDELLTLARAGTMTERSLEIYGPPKRSYVLHTDALSHDGTSIGIIAILEDISNKKHLDEVRRDFVANVSHELKTPIGAMGLLAETLTAEDDSEVAKRLSVRIQNEAFRVGRIIDDLLDLSRIESEDMPLEELVNVDEVASEAVSRMGPSADVRKVTIEHAPSDTSAYVLGDRRQLTSAVYNLLDNAVKYSESDSKVVIEVCESLGWVDITVRDQGIGIPSRDLERIFERFYRVDHARSRSTGGTGLGLSIVRHVINNHKGRVFVESREGSGSAFTLRLPVVESDLE